MCLNRKVSPLAQSIGPCTTIFPLKIDGTKQPSGKQIISNQSKPADARRGDGRKKSWTGDRRHKAVEVGGGRRP